MNILLRAIFSITIFLSCSAYADEDGFQINSAKSAILYDESLYASAGYPQNHDGYQNQLEILWDKAGRNVKVDEYNQPWREVSVRELEVIFGKIDKLYIVVFGDEVFSHKAEKAYIKRWGCDGSLIPMLELGKHKFKNKEIWDGVIALGVSSLPNKLEIKPVNEELIPKEFYGPLRYPSGIELWLNGVKRFSYIGTNEEHNVAPENLLLDHLSGIKRKVIEKSPFDIRC